MCYWKSPVLYQKKAMFYQKSPDSVPRTGGLCRKGAHSRLKMRVSIVLSPALLAFHFCDVTSSWVEHDWLIRHNHAWYMAYLYGWVLFSLPPCLHSTCVTWRVHEWNMTYSYDLCVSYSNDTFTRANITHFFWWVLQHCTGFARLVWGRLRVHRAFIYSNDTFTRAHITHSALLAFHSCDVTSSWVEHD